MQAIIKTLKITSLSLLIGTSSLLAEPTNAELQNQISDLEAKLESMVDHMDKKSKSDKSDNKTHIGGYGELHYNNLSAKGSGSDKKVLDFHRFVLFFGHEFSDTITFHSEFELEHALVSDSGSSPGEVELEQAFIEFQYHDQHRVNAGVFLIPVGIINETHEPPTFYGVERNPVEKNIIPATWWEGGVGFNGQIALGWNYDVAITSGLATSSGSSYAIRSGRQKVAEATAEDLALTGRVKYTGSWGEWGLSLQQQGDVTQSIDATAGSATLVETHVIYHYRGFTIKALYANWSLDGSGPAAIGADEQMGYYIEPSYKITEAVGVFIRYNMWDNRAGDSAGSESKQTNLGVNYWPAENVVIKADYEDQDFDTGTERKGFNLGIGYQF